jgi:hypothetical protein
LRQKVPEGFLLSHSLSLRVSFELPDRFVVR